ncbi:hypothetical protein MJO29_013456 [Puccinia striiformis f. sp. tritici]|nr:hypothetical protein MJO29_013456 [Puccinia striiformis f. sp. tritici]
MAPFLPSSSLNKKPKQKPINFLIYQQHQLYHPIHLHRASSSSSNRDTSTSQSRPIPSSTQPSLPAVPEPSHSHEQEQTSCYKRLGTGQNDGIDSGSSGSDPEDPEVICQMLVPPQAKLKTFEKPSIFGKDLDPQPSPSRPDSIPELPTEFVSLGVGVELLTKAAEEEVDELEEDYDVEEADEIKEERDSQSAYVQSSPISACDWDEDWSTQSSSQQNNVGKQIDNQSEFHSPNCVQSPSTQKPSRPSKSQKITTTRDIWCTPSVEEEEPPIETNLQDERQEPGDFANTVPGYANQENDKLGSPIGAAPDVGEINKQFISKYSAEGVPLPGVAGRRQSSCEASMTPTEGVINLTATGPPTDQPAGVGGPIEPTAKILDYTINMPNIIGSDGECSKQDANLVAAVPHNHDITLNFVDESTAKENCNSLDVLPHSENIVSPNIAPHFIDIDITNIEEATRLLKQLDSGRFFFG